MCLWYYLTSCEREHLLCQTTFVYTHLVRLYPKNCYPVDWLFVFFKGGAREKSFILEIFPQALSLETVNQITVLKKGFASLKARQHLD